MKLSFLVLVICSVLPFSKCLPTGPPVGACASLLPERHIDNGAQDQNLGFTISTDRGSFSPNEEVQVMVRGPGTYRGIFLQVRDGPGDASTAVGSWSRSVVPNLFRLIACPGGPESALGHSTRADKPGNVDFTWTAPDDCTDGNVYLVRATVLRVFADFQSGLIIPMICNNPPPTTTPPPPPTATQSPPPITTQPPPPTTTQPPPPTTTEPPPPATTLPPLPTSTPSPPVQPPVAMCSFSDFDSIPATYNTGFEDLVNPFGGWQVTGDPAGYSWRANSGPTPSLTTGPNNANAGVRYIFVEASNPAQPGNVATLATQNDLRGCFCIRFAESHNTDGSGQTLTVELSGTSLYVNNAESSSPAWNIRQIQVDTPSFVSVRFIATRGTTWVGDIALDSISITPGTC